MRTIGLLVTMICGLVLMPPISVAGLASEAHGPSRSASPRKTARGRSSDMGRESPIAARLGGRTGSDLRIAPHMLPTTNDLRTKRPVNGIYSKIPSGSVMNSFQTSPSRIIPARYYELTKNKPVNGAAVSPSGAFRLNGSSLSTRRSITAAIGGPAHSSRNTTALNGRAIGRRR